MSPTNKLDKQKLRQLQLREEEQDRMIRIIKGDKEVSMSIKARLCNEYSWHALGWGLVTCHSALISMTDL